MEKIVLIDDVILTGQFLKALEELVLKVGGNIVARAAILVQTQKIEKI